MSVVVFHTMVAPHVQQAARAFYETGSLAGFITSVRDNPTSLGQRALTCAAGVLGFDLAREFRRRAVLEVPLETVDSYPYWELLRVAIARVDRDRRLSDLVWERAEHRFDCRVAKKLHKNLTGVYGFENLSHATFTRAKELGLGIAYEMPAPHPAFVRKILREETSQFPQLRTAYDAHLEARDARRMERRGEEWDLADVVITASHFTKKSYEQEGFDVSKVRVVPLGAPPVSTNESGKDRPSKNDGPLRLLWAGGFSLLKGAHYLLDAWRKGDFGRFAQLRVYGSVTLAQRVLHPLPAGITLCGSIPRAELMEQYENSDALLFPTLCDGFGMVATEAWSRGLPVIMTQSAGAADLLRPGENGFLIPARSSEAIEQTIAWCLTHRAELSAMRSSAKTTAQSRQWSDYRRALREATQHVFAARGANSSSSTLNDE